MKKLQQVAFLLVPFFIPFFFPRKLRHSFVAWNPFQRRRRRDYQHRHIRDLILCLQAHFFPAKALTKTFLFAWNNALANGLRTVKANLNLLLTGI